MVSDFLLFFLNDKIRQIKCIFALLNFLVYVFFPFDLSDAYLPFGITFSLLIKRCFIITLDLNWCLFIYFPFIIIKGLYMENHQQQQQQQQPAFVVNGAVSSQNSHGIRVCIYIYIFILIFFSSIYVYKILSAFLFNLYLIW